MKNLKRDNYKLYRFSSIFILIVSILGFQNCGDQFVGTSVNLENCSEGDCSAAINTEFSSCDFNGSSVLHGDSTTAYLNSVSPDCQGSVLEERSCSHGELDGNFDYAVCDSDREAKKACLFNGKTLLHEESVTAFMSSTVGSNESCSEETRVCNDGVLSGDYEFSFCKPKAEKACLFGDKTIAHSHYVKAYKESTNIDSETCEVENRVCINGKLSGDYAYSSCKPDAPRACLFKGRTILDSQVITAFKLDSDGQTCLKEERTCSDSKLSGTYNMANCKPPRSIASEKESCEFNSKEIKHNENIKAYETSSVPFGTTCKSQTRKCSNGKLSGNYTFSTCSVNSSLSCTYNGKSVANNSTLILYKTKSVNFGEACKQESVLCLDGKLQIKNYKEVSCNVNPASSCKAGNITVAHSNQKNFYRAPSVPFGQNCQKQIRTCNNGTFTGSYAHTSCTVDTPNSCKVGNVTIKHNEKKTFYNSSTVSFGNSCKTQVRTCNNGILSGSYSKTSCSVAAPASCKVGNVTIKHNDKKTFYNSSSVPFGQSCRSQVRTCNNGFASGTSVYSHVSCSAAAPLSCKHDGKTFAHGKSFTAYRSSIAFIPSKCSSSSKALKCDNGKISLASAYPKLSCREIYNPKTSCTYGKHTLADGEGIVYFVSILSGVGPVGKFNKYSKVPSNYRNSYNRCLPAAAFCEGGKLISVNVGGGSGEPSSRCGNVEIGRPKRMTYTKYNDGRPPPSELSSTPSSTFPLPSTPYYFGDK